MTHKPEFSGLKGRFCAWFLSSPLRAVLNWRMGNPDPRLMELLALEGSETVVDAGCGSGHHSLMIAERLDRGRVIGIDMSREMLDKLRRDAKRRGLGSRVEAIEADALALPLEDGSAERAITVAAWHHLDDPLRACKELARVLRPGGRLVAVDLAIGDGKRPHRHIPGHDRPFGESDMRRLLEASQLQEPHVETLGSWVVGTGVKSISAQPGDGSPAR